MVQKAKDLSENQGLLNYSVRRLSDKAFEEATCDFPQERKRVQQPV